MFQPSNELESFIVNGVEFGDRLLVGAVESLGRQRTLTHINDHERDVHLTFGHLWKIYLRAEAHGVVAIGGEVSRVDVVMSVELDDLVMDGLSFRDESGVV